ncbi:hypothetical protein A1O3_08627 [Capronia epimyces CBS 606.96]|uniref:CENP-V/GFA domain-containing protein n=1 Tax=Capronia epimyces CBS 606.96 TaxID=1182542 RepID=W9XQ63_9EURO|nr:uncharacterized protein A1O3_08627 [Capronia epimyces CBS 606.96]EXJ79126.1 hypothetical protein A1O3_08627 [Capronia epimyces CBS 606.96]
MSGPTPAKRPFTGGCHCGSIKYEATILLTDHPVATRCNCTICLKQGFTGVQLDPQDFRLLSPESFSQIKDYQFRSKDVHKYFCDTCGIHVVGRGQFEYEGSVHHFFALNILTLDQPQEGLDLARFKIKYVDGKNDNFKAGARDVPWPWGCV